MMIIGIIILVVIVGLIFLWFSTYNRLVAAKTQVDESASQIDVQLKRRNDLIPNLVNTVKGSSNYERGTLTKVTELRDKLYNLDFKSNPQMAMQISSQLAQNLKTVFSAVAENYPDLKANQNFQSLLEELSNTENKIGYARQLYNKCVAQYNQLIQVVPTNIVASVSHFEKRDYLEVPTEEKQTPQVNFDDLK